MRRRSPALGLAALLAAGCATAPMPSPPDSGAGSTAPVEWAFEVRAALAPARLPEDAGDLEILNTVASIIADDLKLPLPDKVLALAYTNDARFAEALRRRGARP